MGPQLHNLEGQRAAMQEGQGRVQEAAKKAVHSLLSGVALRRQMAGDQARIREEEVKLRQLERRAQEVQKERSEIEGKLKAMTVPRVASSERRLLQERTKLAETESEAARWGTLREKYKASAVQSLAQRQHSLEGWRQAQAQVQEAERRANRAELEYEKAKERVSREIEALKYARAKFEAEKGEVQREAIEERNEEQSIKRALAVFKMEAERVKVASTKSEERLLRRMARTKQLRDEAALRLAEDRKRYEAWQEEQKRRADEAGKFRQEFEARAKAYEEGRQQVVAQASAKAGQSATADGDWAWDDWAWNGRGEAV